MNADPRSKLCCLKDCPGGDSPQNKFPLMFLGLVFFKHQYKYILPKLRSPSELNCPFLW